MAILNNPEDFTSGENVTAAKLNNLVDGATFLGGAGEATDGSTLEVNDGVGGDGSLRVKDGGIITAKLADGAVNTQKIADSAVTLGKIQNISTSKVIGRITAGSGNAEEVSILDQDDMSSDSTTALATQQSIKAYIDNSIAALTTVLTHDTGWFNDTTGLTNNTTYAFTHSLNSNKLVFQIYVADDNTGTNAVALDVQYDNLGNTTDTWGAIVNSITTTGFSVNLGFRYLSSIGAAVSTSFVGKYIRVIAVGF